MYDRSAWFLRVIMSSSRALYCLPSVKKQKHDFNFSRSIYNKTIIRFGFCDIQNNRGLGKGYQPQPSASADNPYLYLDYSGYHKNPNNCLESVTVYMLIPISNVKQAVFSLPI